jgi:hypothetical protein
MKSVKRTTAYMMKEIKSIHEMCVSNLLQTINSIHNNISIINLTFYSRLLLSPCIFSDWCISSIGYAALSALRQTSGEWRRKREEEVVVYIKVPPDICPKSLKENL